MSTEENLLEESRDPPLNPENYLNPASRAPISTDTAVSKNFYQSMPGSSSSALVDPFSTKSGPHEFQMQNREGIFKSGDFSVTVFVFPLKVSMPNNVPRNVSHWRKCQIEEVELSAHHCQSQATIMLKIASV